MDNDQILAAMRLDMERHNLMESSIIKREICLKAFMRWSLPSILEATTDDLQRFIDGRRTRSGAEIGARAKFTWAANFAAFYRFAVGQEWIDADPTEKLIRPKLARGLPRPAPTVEIERILRIAPPKERCWLLLAAYQGLRCQEIAGLRREDVIDGERLLRVEYGKGGKVRVLELHGDVMDALNALPMPRSGWLFTRMMGGKYTPNALSMYFNQFLRDNGTDTKAHQLRHWFGTNVYRSSHDIRLTQDLMGHSDPGTTAGYTAFSRKDARKTIDSLTFSPSQPDEAA